MNKIAPFELAEPWDNVGLLLGSRNTAVTKILVALDVTLPVIEEAVSIGANLIVTHHPVIYTPLKSVDSGSFQWRLISAGISVICAHTNLDKADGGVNDVLAQTVGLTNISSPPELLFGRLGELSSPMSPEQFAASVASKLKAHVKYNSTQKPIRRVAVIGGSCSQELDALPAGTDAVLTGETRHNFRLDAARLGVCLLEAGHYHTENTIIPVLAKKLADMLTGTDVIVSVSSADGVTVAAP